MKTKKEIAALRKRLIDAWAPFARRYSHPLASTQATTEQIHFMAAGAVGFASAILQLDVPDSLTPLIAAIEKDNEPKKKPKRKK